LKSREFTVEQVEECPLLALSVRVLPDPMLNVEFRTVRDVNIVGGVFASELLKEALVGGA